MALEEWWGFGDLCSRSIGALEACVGGALDTYHGALILLKYCNCKEYSIYY
jgi:hypothetical protein